VRACVNVIGAEFVALFVGLWFRSSSVSMWEQLSLAAFLQRYWADNQVSCTITFDPECEGRQLSAALDVYQYQLKGASFLPRLPSGAYAQMPYEEIDEVKYKAMVSVASVCVAE
jgi:ribonucleoside-triphosphate reductase (thioredoxin)